MKIIKISLLLFATIFGLSTSEKKLQPKDWWEKTIFYQIYPRSFKDSDGDGVGDLKGITSKLHHLKDTGIGAAWLSPIFQSPMVDFGYDISNFVAIQDEYGTMEDFRNLMTTAKELGIKIILDFVPNHSSDQHEWFINSVNRVVGYEDYYIWHSGFIDADGVRHPPNNWVSVFYGSAWTWNDFRQQYYLHQFTKGQPDLNFRNPAVVQEMDNVLKFWLAKGVDGFRVDAVNHLFQVEDFSDEPQKFGRDADPQSYGYLKHDYTKDLPESYEMVYHWREVLDNWTKDHGGDTRIMMTEAYANITFTMKYYVSDDGKRRGSHMPFNFILITDLNGNSTANDFIYAINKWIVYMPLGETANWVLGNHDKSRVGTRYGAARIDSLNTLLLTLPGVSVTYNGEEIGMLDNENITWAETKDPAACNTNEDIFHKYTRDPERTPFQWDDTKNAGFSTASATWLPINSNYVALNLKQQQESDRSHYKLYKQLSELRKKPTMIYGTFNPIALNKHVLAYTRELEGHETFVVVINLSGNQEIVNLDIFPRLPEKLRVVTATSTSKYNIGDEVITKYTDLGQYECLILQPTTSIQIIRQRATNFWLKDLIYSTTILILLATSFYTYYSCFYQCK